MSDGARISPDRSRRMGMIVALLVAIVMLAACGGTSNSSSDGKVKLEFAQWWAKEMPKGQLQKIVDSFEKKNPNISIKLQNQPYDTLQQQTTSNAASGELSDVVALDGAWVSNLHKVNALADLSKLMKGANYSGDDLADQIKIDGTTYMIPVTNFTYPLFTNDNVLKKANVSHPPKTRRDFVRATKKISALNKTRGWILPLSTNNPNGAKNDVMSWLWADNGRMMKDGKANLSNNAKALNTFKFIKSVKDSGGLAKGESTLKETDKMNQFKNNQVGMMVDSLAHITSIKKSNPNLKFHISPQPTTSGQTGKSGLNYASWGVGVSQKTSHKKEAWKFVQYLMNTKVNGKIATEAHGFPGNKKAKPDISDPMEKKAFKIYKKGDPVDEFSGLPKAKARMRDMDEELQKYLNGDQDADAALKNTQDKWESKS